MLNVTGGKSVRTRRRSRGGPISGCRQSETRRTFGGTASPAMKRICAFVDLARVDNGMSPTEFEARVYEWANRRSDIEALIQIGSRVQPGGHVDVWSDWDFHLITREPRKYYQTDWLADIAPIWCAHSERSLRGVVKVSAVFDNGMEADFIPLAAWQMKLVYWSMKYPRWSGWMPRRLRRGILETRVILLGSGSRVLIGGQVWEKRLDALKVNWPTRRMSASEYEQHLGAFWQKSVWVGKKIARPEPRSAMHWLHKMVVEHVYALLEEEAWLSGRTARPEALKAEKWLAPKRMQQTAITTSLDQRVLARALLAEIELFEEVSLSVAQSRGFSVKDYSNVARWLKAELGKLT